MCPRSRKGVQLNIMVHFELSLTSVLACVIFLLVWRRCVKVCAVQQVLGTHEEQVRIATIYC